MVVVSIQRFGVPTVGGQAFAAFIPSAPAIGACLLQDPRTAAVSSDRVPTPSYGPCGAAHYGEVVQVYNDSDLFPRIDLGGITAPDPATCEPAAHSYLGADQVSPRFDRGDYRSVSFGPWRPVATGSVGVIEPSAPQRIVGQRWIACVTLPKARLSFTGTVHDAFTGGVLPDAYASCADEFPVRSSIDCSIPHRVELFATTSRTYDLPGLADLNTSCNQFIQYVTGRTDLPSDGRLAVRAVSVLIKPGGDPDTAEGFCGITSTGNYRLTATLFGVGNGPLPLS